MHAMPESEISRRFRRMSGFFFAAMMCAFAVWVLSLPVFPTQDGPMHRYYIHVLDAVLHHSQFYSAYRIRHPFPPYATQYGLTLVLSHVMSYDMAEKLFVLLILFTFGYGLRFCAISCGEAGNAVSFFAAPILLHWALMMGFMNYSLAVGIFLFIAGCWQRALLGRRVYWIPFALLVCCLTLTHPVPLLILVAVCALDLLLRAWLFRGRAHAMSLRTVLWSVCGLAFCLLAFKIPAASLEKHATASIFGAMGFDARTTGRFLLLTGVSPYYLLTHSILPNLYRLVLYGVFVGAMLMGARHLRRHWASRTLAFSDTFFISTILLALAIPILPDYVNGSGYFATRLVVLLWVGALMAASGVDLSRKAAVHLRSAALVCAAITLLTAQVYFRPLAVALHQVEMQTLPQNQFGLLLGGIDLDNYVHHHDQVAFSPFAWGPALAFVHSNDVILDSPWLDLNISPLQVVPGSPVFAEDIRLTHLSKTDPGFQPNASLPRSQEHALADRATVILDADTPVELQKGIREQFMPEDAARFSCQHVNWYLVCQAR